MKLAIDAQLIFEVEKTGIGRNAQMIMEELTKIPEMECVLNIFFRGGKKGTKEVLDSYREKGCVINQNHWMPSKIYNHLERIIPSPYSWIFGQKAPVTLFFNYTIPFGVKGKAMTFIHDVAFLTHPETVAKKTHQWLDNNIEKYCKRASMILTVSEFSKQEIHNLLGVPLEKIRVVYNGVDRKKFHPNCTPEEIDAVKRKYGIDGDYYLYLGTLEPRKNIDFIIDAVKQLKDEGKLTKKLVLVGKKGWLYDKLFTMVEDYGMKDDIIFTGYVSDEEATVLLNGADIFLFPSLYEGFGIPPLEAMACGTPVITSDTSSLPEVVGDAGMMVGPHNVRELSTAIYELSTDRALRERYIAAGFKQVDRFTWENAAQQLYAAYKELL